MKVLFAVSECSPFAKTGGLGDVAGSLPKELKKFAIDMRVILPKYETINECVKKKMKKIGEYTVQIGWRNQYCGIEELHDQGLTYYFVDNEYYYKREGIYGHSDDGERFVYFNRAVLESLAYLKFFPDIIHCNDWHTAMIPYLLRTDYQKRSGYGLIRTILTIHNLQFQGIFPPSILSDLLGLNDQHFQIEKLEFFGNVNFMKGGIVASDLITTVSPTYKQEIMTSACGEKLEGLLRMREKDIYGILNGIDEGYYHPQQNPFILQPYGIGDTAKKTVNKLEIQKRFGLPENPETPLMVMVSRLTRQKGLDLIKFILPEMLESDLQFIILGTGDRAFEEFLKQAEEIYSDKMRILIGFHESLSHQLYAAADLFLMPSLFEPCGLSQMIAMKYGAVPIVRETGGLNDTVLAWNEFTKEGNGFSFKNFNAHDMLFTIRRALHFYQDRDVWRLIVENAMKMDFSWEQSAYEYQSLYKELISGSKTHD